MSESTVTFPNGKLNGPITSSSFSINETLSLREMAPEVSQKLLNDTFKYQGLYVNNVYMFSDHGCDCGCNMIINETLKKVDKKNTTIRADTQSLRTLTLQDLCEFASDFMTEKAAEDLVKHSNFKISNIVQDRNFTQLPEKSMIKSLVLTTIDKSPICWEDIDNVSFLLDGRLLTKIDSFVLKRCSPSQDPSSCDIGHFLFSHNNPMYTYKTFGFQVNFHKEKNEKNFITPSGPSKRYLYEADYTLLDISIDPFKTASHYEAFWSLINNNLVHPIRQVSTVSYNMEDKKNLKPPIFDVPYLYSKFPIQFPKGMISEIQLHLSNSQYVSKQNDRSILDPKKIEARINFQTVAFENDDEWVLHQNCHREHYESKYFEQGKYWVLDPFCNFDSKKSVDASKLQKDLELNVIYHRQPFFVFAYVTVFNHNIIVFKNGKIGPLIDL